MRGEYVGVGLEIEEKNGRVVIVAPLDNSPAFAAGLHAGEQILRVNNKAIADQGLAEVVDLIVGPAGSTVVLSVFDPASRTTSDVTLKRAQIRVDNVSWQPVPGSSFADVRIAGFSAGVTKEVRAALQAIQDAKLQGVVLDMRNNPGGELGEAIGLASQFLPSGDVVLEKDAKGAVTHDAVRRGGVAPRVPLVVLINGGTASGAEIVAGAIQDARRGPLIGETTFGTGTVLEDFPLSDGSSLLLAVREWLTPEGRTIWHKGIVPDTPLPLPLDSEIVTPASLKGMTKADFDTSTDVQLKKALEMLSTQVAHPLMPVSVTPSTK
jgi:carboxyl-terminal processing protease